MANSPSRMMALRYGGNQPQTGGFANARVPGGCCVIDRNVLDFAASRTWCRDSRALGAEVLLYVNAVEMFSWTVASSGEEFKLYGGPTQSQISQTNPEYFWSAVVGGSPSSYQEFPGLWMTNMFPGSPWITHVVDWAVGLFQDRAFDVVDGVKRYCINGFMLDVMGVEPGGSTPANWTTQAADWWTEGNFDLARRLRAALGPDPTLVCNGPWYRFRQFKQPKDIVNIALVDQANATAMKSGFGGCPDINGMMFESAPDFFSVARVDDTINAANGPGTTMGSIAPNGMRWAERCSDRKRFQAISDDANGGNLANYVSITDLTWVGWMRGGYTGTDNPVIAGTVQQRLNDQLADDWIWTPTGTPPPDPEPDPDLLPPGTISLDTDGAGNLIGTGTLVLPANVGVRTHVALNFRQNDHGIEQHPGFGVGAPYGAAAGTIAAPWMIFQADDGEAKTIPFDLRDAYGAANNPPIEGASRHLRAFVFSSDPTAWFTFPPTTITGRTDVVYGQSIPFVMPAPAPAQTNLFAYTSAAVATTIYRATQTTPSPITNVAGRTEIRMVEKAVPVFFEIDDLGPPTILGQRVVWDPDLEEWFPLT